MDRFTLFHVLVIAVLLSACNSIQINGVVVVRKLQERHESCGLSVLPPQVKGVQYYAKPQFAWLYDTICCITYVKYRKGQRDFSFRVKYSSTDLFVDTGETMGKQFEYLIRNDPGNVFNDLARIEDMTPVEYLGLSALRYHVTYRHTEGGDLGLVWEHMGYFFQHPENNHWFVRIEYVDRYNLLRGQSPDEAMRAVGEEFLHSVRRIPLKPEEQTGEARDREVESWGRRYR